MARPTVVIELAACARDLAAGGVFAPGCALALTDECDLIVRGAADELRLAARVVFVDASGAGLEILGFGPEVKAALDALAAAPAPERDAPKALHERLRGLSLAEQVKMASAGEPHERILLERLYGKHVWEPLLRNPRLTPPEVARLARMGALPRVLLEIIVGNNTWLQVPEVRRALLANPRLGTEHVVKVLRFLSRQELKLAPTQTAYSRAVREAARRMLDGSIA